MEEGRGKYEPRRRKGREGRGKFGNGFCNGFNGWMEDWQRIL